MKSVDHGQDRSSSLFLDKEAALLAFARQRRRRSSVSSPRQEASDPSILAPGVRIGESYEVGPIIGAGPLGIVYKARHLERGELVAVQVLRPDRTQNSSAWLRFERESRALAALHNPHVVEVHEAGMLDSGLRYLVMELLTGCTLRVLLGNGPVEPALAAEYGLQLCSALSDAHRANIIHRDIRPENVFVVKRGEGEPSVKLTGFGMALFLDDGQHYTVTRRSSARPDYLAPEQLQEPSVVDTRSDVWAVGMTLYELVAGRTPFFGKNIAQTCLQIAAGDIPRVEVICPETVCPRVMGGIAGVIHRCLQLDPGQRYASVDELARALEPFTGRGGAVAPVAPATEAAAAPEAAPESSPEFALEPLTQRWPAPPA
jgi:eukaryotic-like serine/threonine-protein kinase